MQFVTIKGRLNGLGDSLKHDGAYRTYDYITVEKDDGSEVHIGSIKVHDMVNHVLLGSLGDTGTIILSKTALGQREMHVASFNGYVGADQLAQGNMGTIYASLAGLLFISFMQSLIIIGIPNLVRCLWTAVTIGGYRKILAEQMAQANVLINQSLQTV